MVGKIIVIIVIVLLLGFGVFIYEVIAHPHAMGLPSWFGAAASSSMFNFSLSSQRPAQGPPELPPAVPSTTTIITAAGSSSTPAVDPSQIPAGYTIAELSPYFHQVRFGGISAGTAYYYGTITLDTQLNPGEEVDITGWQIKGNDGGEYVPQAVDLYDPSGLTAPSDIILQTNDTVSIYSSSAPVNLRLNECIGYVTPMINSNPSLPLTCPYVDRSAIQNFTGACQNYIESLGNCQQPNLTNPEVPRTDYACQDYLENNFNYKSCFQEHVSDPNFLSNQVWVWTGSNVVDPDHDTVRLLDKNGLLVDIYSY
jgi:hypothetical protein